MKKDIIVFDKDGTLMDFDSFWIALSVSAITDVLKKLNKEDVDINLIMKSFGVENGVVDIDGILCKGTYEQLGMAMYAILKQAGCEKPKDTVLSMIVGAYNANMDLGCIKPTCGNIKDVLMKLKNDGRKLVVVTTDNFESTSKCLDELGIREFFDMVFTDDGKTPVKPDPHCILEYCKSVGSSPDKMVMVGDTLTDVMFARNAGMDIIGVGSNEKSKQLLKLHTDVVIDDISYIFDALKEVE